MPWVRMHALRGYRDVVLDTIAEGAAVTINVVPSLLDLPSGCTFQERCTYVMTKCRLEPPFCRVSDTHRVRCWLHER